MSSLNHTITANFESWFIVINVLTIISLALAILLAVTFLAIIMLNKTCQTIPIIFAGNSCIGEIIYGCDMLSISVFRLENDIKQRVFQDTLCAFRDYLSHVGTALLLYSFTLQALYRYIIVIYPTRILWQSVRVQGTLICFSWLFCIILFLPWLPLGTAAYNVDNQACILPFQFSVPIIYNVTLVYLIPVSMNILIYFKLVRYVYQISHRPTLSDQTLQIARREVVMVRCSIIIISILVILGLPYTIFMLMSFITHPPKYFHRIAVLFSDLSQTFIMIIVFQFSQPVMDVLLKFKRRFLNTVHPTTA